MEGRGTSPQGQGSLAEDRRGKCLSAPKLFFFPTGRGCSHRYFHEKSKTTSGVVLARSRNQQEMTWWKEGGSTPCLYLQLSSFGEVQPHVKLSQNHRIIKVGKDF